MEVGQLNKLDIAFVIQARMQSTRLPGKVLMPLPFAGTKPIIQWITDELCEITDRSNIFIATSVNPENDPIEKFSIPQKIKCFRGDEEDVLSRFIAIAEIGEFDLIVRLTGDNPMIDSKSLNDTIKFHLERGNSYTYTRGLPIGMNFEILNAKDLLGLKDKKLSSEEKEHVTPYFRNNDFYKKSCLQFSNLHESIRVTIDYPSDYLVLSSIFEIGIKEKLSGLKLIKKIQREFSWIFQVNSQNVQKKRFITLNDELIEAEKILMNYDFKKAAEILKNYRA